MSLQTLAPAMPASSKWVDPLGSSPAVVPSMPTEPIWTRHPTDIAWQLIQDKLSLDPLLAAVEISIVQTTVLSHDVDKGGEVALQLATSLTHHLALSNRRNRSWAKGVLPLLVKGLTLGDLFCKAFGNVFWSYYMSEPIELGNLTDYGRAFYYLIDAGIIPPAIIVSVLGEVMSSSFRDADKCDRFSASDVRRLVDSLGYVLLCIETKAWGKSTYRSLYSTAMLVHAASVYEHKNMHDLASNNVPHLKDPSVIMAARHFYTPSNNRFIRSRCSLDAQSRSVPSLQHSSS